EGIASQKLLTTVQEDILKKWIKWLGYAGLPLSKRILRLKVKSLCGQTPGKRWIDRFLRRNPDCMLGRPSGLDPKRAQAFNRTNVNKHFKLLQDLFDDEDILLSNVFNFDEIGIQLGGGRHNSGELFLFRSEDKSQYKVKSDE